MTKYHIKIKPFHVFQIDNYYYLIRTRSLFYDPINEGIYLWLREKEGQFVISGDDNDRNLLKSLNLIAKKKDPSTISQYLEIDKQIWKNVSPNFLRLRDLYLMVTQHCNMSCSYCFAGDGEYGSQGIMDESTAMKAVDWFLIQAGDIEELNITFFGGEPLLNFPVIRSVVRYIKSKVPDKKVRFSLSTNGSIISDEILSFLKTEKIWVQISFDGLPEYQLNRRMKNGASSYKRVLKNIHHFLTVIPNCSAKACLCWGSNKDAVIDALIDLGFSTVCVSYIQNTLINPNQDQRTQYSTELEKRYLKDKIEIVSKNISLRNRELLPKCIFELSTAKIFFGWDKRPTHLFCKMGKRMLTVSVDGRVYPCQGFVGNEAYCLGSISDTGIMPRKEFGGCQIIENTKCAKCWAKYVCGGGCARENYVECNDFFTPPEWRCDLTRYRLELTIHADNILSEEDRLFFKDIFYRKA